MEKTLAILSDIAKHPVWIYKNNRLVYANDKLKKILKVNIDEVDTNNFEELINKITLEYIANGKLTYNDIDYDYNILENKINGEDYKICILEQKTEAISTDSTHIDILNTIIENIPEIVFYKDTKGRYIGANKHCINFYKNRGIENIIGKTDLEFDLDQDFINTCVKHDSMVINTKKPLYIEEGIPNNNDGIEFVETVKIPILDKNNEVHGIVGLVRDITFTKRRIDKLKKLSQLDKLTGLYNRGHFDKMIELLDTEENYPLSVIIGDVDGLKVTNDAFGHFVGDDLLINISNVIKESCRAEDLIFRIGGDEIAIILPKTSKEDSDFIKRRIVKTCKDAPSTPIPLSISLGSGTKFNKTQDTKEIIRSAEKELYKQKLRSQEKLYYGQFALSFIVESIRENLLKRVSDIKEHIENTIKYSTIIGKELGFSDYQLNELNLGAMLHDIGMAAIEDEYLCKSTIEIDKDDVKILSDHSEKGYRIVKSYSNLGDIANVILSHHESWDGSGYPFGISGEAIPLNARIINLASDFDIILRKNKNNNLENYKEVSIDEIIDQKGKCFDPKLVDILVSSKDLFE